MKSLHDENLEKAREYLKHYKEKHPSKLFKGVHLRYFTKEELIKILDHSAEYNKYYITDIMEKYIPLKGI